MNLINIKDIEGNTIELGDKVRVLKITDDSGTATDLFGVEPQLDSWLTVVYIEPLEGIVTYDSSKLMVVIKSKSTSLPLSSYIRHSIYYQAFEQISNKEVKEFAEELNLPNCDYDTIINYIKKI